MTNQAEFDRLCDNVKPKAKLPRAFHLWSRAMQVLWLKQNQKPVKR